MMQWWDLIIQERELCRQGAAKAAEAGDTVTRTMYEERAGRMTQLISGFGIEREDVGDLRHWLDKRSKAIGQLETAHNRLQELLESIWKKPVPDQLNADQANEVARWCMWAALNLEWMNAWVLRPGFADLQIAWARQFLIDAGYQVTELGRNEVEIAREGVADAPRRMSYLAMKNMVTRLRRGEGDDRADPGSEVNAGAPADLGTAA